VSSVKMDSLCPPSPEGRERRQGFELRALRSVHDAEGQQLALVGEYRKLAFSPCASHRTTIAPVMVH